MRDYKINKKLYGFCGWGNNFGTKYEHYLGYKVLGAQVLGGLRIVLNERRFFVISKSKNLKSKIKKINITVYSLMDRTLISARQ